MFRKFVELPKILRNVIARFDQDVKLFSCYKKIFEVRFFQIINFLKFLGLNDIYDRICDR